MKPSSTRTIIAFALAALLTAIGSGCSTPRIPTTEDENRRLTSGADLEFGSQSECTPEFPDAKGWYGGDAAYSVALPAPDERTSLWLFGDSFVQRPNELAARSYPFVHNSIGLSHCDPNGHFSLETFWGIDASGSPVAFFEPDPNAAWVSAAMHDSGIAPYYWLLDGFIAHDTLFVGLLRVVHSEAHGPFNLPFRLAGMDLARIENYRDAPQDWRIQISTLSDRRDAFPGSAFVVTSRHVHAFAFLDSESGTAARILSRLEIDALAEWRADVSDSLETLRSGGNWMDGFDPGRAAILMRDEASEMSVHYDVVDGNWIAVYSDLSPRASLETEIVIRSRTAPDLEGPWSKPEDLVAIPESRADDPRSRDENLFCYAGKAHPQFSTTSRLLITYVCNLYVRNPGEVHAVLERLRTSADLYRPLPISVDRTGSARADPVE